MSTLCPECGEVLIEDVYATAFENDRYLNFCSGECLKCKKTFKWVEKFIFDEITAFREVK